MARSKDVTNVVQAAPYLPFETLSATLLSPIPAPAPADNGSVSLIVLRPEENARRIVEEVELSVTHGMAGSGWTENPEKGKIDQICVMGTSAIRAVAGDDEERWAPAGDQIFLEMDLAKSNFDTGDRVSVGRDGVGQDVVLEVSPKPHHGCSKFAKRYGGDALKIMNCSLGRERRLRGLYFWVVKAGVVRRGDKVVKVARDFRG